MKNIWLVLTCVFAFAKAFSQEPSPENIVFYYDVSYSMRDRNVNVELDFLDSYFIQHPNTIVTLHTLSTALSDKTTHTVSEGNWDTLKSEIIEVDYDGASDFSTVDFNQKADGFLLSTDGEHAISKLPKAGKVSITIINTVREDTGGLKWLAQSSGGIYEELLTDSSSIKKPLKSKATSTVKRVTQQDVKPSQTPNSSELDAVTITDYSTDPDREEYNTINVGGVDYDKKKLGYSVEKITSKEVSQLDTDTRQAVKGQFAGLNVANDDSVNKVNLAQFTGRHNNMSINGDQTGLIVIDGVPQAKANSGAGSGSLYSVDNSYANGRTSGINPDNIRSITYLKGLAATNRYGSLGKGGVIEIVTKTAGGSSNKKRNKKKELGTTPTYTGEASIMSDLPETDYIKALAQTTTINDALNTYLTYRETYGDQAAFFLNTARYFKGWKKPDITTRILSNVTEVAANDIATLRALSYVYEDIGEYQSLVALTEHILDLEAANAQSYLDLARAYRLAGQNKKALEEFNKIVSTSGLSNVNFSGIKETAVKEYKQFVTTSSNGLPASKILPAYRTKPVKLARRIVVEYSDPEALFDLKIINPQDRFFTWSHTTTGEAARLIQEKQQGFNQEEFFLTETDKGQWRFNVINYGTSQEKPLGSTFLKITIFKNWGSTNQTREVKIVQLSELNKEEQILSLSI